MPFVSCSGTEINSCNRATPLEWPSSLLIPVKPELLMHSLQVSAGHKLYLDW